MSSPTIKITRNEQLNAARKLRQARNPERFKAKVKESNRKSYLKNKAQNVQKAREYRVAHPGAARIYGRESYWRNPDKFKARSRRRTASGVDREKVNERARLRHRSEPMTRVIQNLRVRVRDALSGRAKSEATKKLMGCPVVWLEAHLESIFKPGMTWENYGPVWHVDHIKPCASFNLADPEQQRICFHWTNLQPLFAEENLKKGDKC